VTDLRGRGNKLGVAQNADNAYLDFSMEGSNNRGAIYQNRDGSRFSANVVGRNNTVIYRDN
jgi:hypothetical protein